MSRLDGVVKFDFGKLTKSRKVGAPPPSLTFESYPHEVELCLVTTLDLYLERSRLWRNKGQSQLLLGFQNPHGEVTAETIARLIKTILRIPALIHRFSRLTQVEVQPPQRLTLALALTVCQSKTFFQGGGGEIGKAKAIGKGFKIEH